MSLGLAEHVDRPGRTLSVVLADPDPATMADVVEALRDRGISSVMCRDGADALFRIGHLRPDLVLVASLLPVVDVATLVGVVRRHWSIPVIVGIGDGDTTAATAVLEAGATACVARPYRLPELVPLFESAVAELPNRQSALEVGAVRLDPAAHDVRVKGRPVHMPLREFEVLEYLMRHRDRVVTPQQLLAAVWGSSDGDTNTISVHIRRLRIKLGDDPRNPKLIRTLRGLGYRFGDGSS